MAGEGGYRPWWRFRQRVNVSNGNFLLVFAQGSCVTCGGASQSAYPDPREKRVLGLCGFEYELDPAGNRLSMKDKDAKYTFYGLDPNYQLHSETKLASKSNTATRELQYMYGYDGNGNRTTQHKDGVLTSYTIGDNNELTAIGTTNLTYDHFGNTLTNGLFSYTWDFEGHMLSGVRSGLPTSTDTHECDGDGRRMRSKWNNAADWTNFVYDELEGSYPAILAEYTLISGTFTIKSLNTHGIGLINTNREGTKRYFHFDGLGSTWALTDGSEVVQDTYTWSAFGVQEASTGSSVNPFRYVGQFGYYDDTARGSVLGLRCLGVRYYSPSLGRFLSWDPLEPGDYSYVNNRATQAADPNGDQPWWWYLGDFVRKCTLGDELAALNACRLQGCADIDRSHCEVRRFHFGSYSQDFAGAPCLHCRGKPLPGLRRLPKRYTPPTKGFPIWLLVLRPALPIMGRILQYRFRGCRCMYSGLRRPENCRLEE